MDQGDLEIDGSVAPARSRLTPARALLLALGAVIAGVALSLLIDSSPAHAADGDGAGPGAALSPLVSATSSVTSASGSVRHGVAATFAAALDQGVPLVQRAVDTAGKSVTSTVPISAPLVAPVLSSVDATFTAARRLAAPAVGTLLQLANSAAVHDQWLPSQALTHPASAAQTGSAVAGIAGGPSGLQKGRGGGASQAEIRRRRPPGGHASQVAWEFQANSRAKRLDAAPLTFVRWPARKQRRRRR